jgi:tRNA 2-thiouridine synthesizing protein E
MGTVNRQRVPFQGSQIPSLQFDARGFLADPCTWTKETSQLIAEMDGIGPLSPEHWRLIWHLRSRYLLGCTLLGVRRISADCNAKDAVHRLFGNCKAAWRVAGLPDPGEQVMTYMV